MLAPAALSVSAHPGTLCATLAVPISAQLTVPVLHIPGIRGQAGGMKVSVTNE